MPAAAILAGGLARRYGGCDKSALQIGAETLLNRQLASLRQVADHLLIVARDGDGCARYAAAGVAVIADRVPHAGALGGVYTAVVASPEPQTLVVACDLPFLDPAFLRYVLETGRDVDAAVPRDANGWQPLCASYSRACAAVIRERIDARALKLTDLLTHLRVREIGPEEIARFDPSGVMFTNVNTPGDLARALELLKRAGG